VGTRRPQDILGRKEVPSMSKMKSKSSKGTSFQPIWTVFLDVHIVQGQRWLHLGRPGNVPVSTEFIFIKKSLNINLLSLLRFRSWKLFSRQFKELRDIVLSTTVLLLNNAIIMQIILKLDVLVSVCAISRGTVAHRT